MTPIILKIRSSVSLGLNIAAVERTAEPQAYTIAGTTKEIAASAQAAHSKPKPPHLNTNATTSAASLFFESTELYNCFKVVKSDGLTVIVAGPSINSLLEL